MTAAYKVIELDPRGTRYEIFDADGNLIGQGEGGGPQNLPTRSEYEQSNTLVPGTIVQGRDRAGGGIVGETFQRVETIQTPAGPQNVVRTYRLIETPGGIVETDITDQVSEEPVDEADPQGDTTTPTGPSSNVDPCRVQELPGGPITEAIEENDTPEFPNQSQYVVIRVSGRQDDPVVVIQNTDTGEEFTLREGDIFQGAAVQAISFLNKTATLDDGTVYSYITEEVEREPIDPSRYTTEYIRGLSNGVASVFDSVTERGYQVGVGDTISGFRIRTIDARGITLEDGTVIQYGGIQTNPGGDIGVDEERQGSPTYLHANEFADVVAPMSGGSGR